MTAENIAESHSVDKAPKRRRRVLLVVVLGIVILAGGMVIGSSATIMWMHHRMMKMTRDPDAMTREIAQRIRSELDLNDSQAAEVEKILRKHHEAMMAIFRESEPRVKAEVDTMRSDIAAQLTPEQAKKWNDEFDRIFPPMPPGEPPPPPEGR